MIHIAIVEDVAADQKRLQEYVRTYLTDKQRSFTFYLFSDAESFLDNYPTGLDLVFLDIEMKQMDGIQAARRIRQFDDHVQILFVTNMVQFALEGYAVDAADFIVKPVSYPSFCARMDKLMRKWDAHQNSFLMTKRGKETVCCRIQDITYIESINKQILIHRKSMEPLPCSEPLYALEKKLGEEPFFRCHNAFLVNMDHVQSVNATDVSVNDVQIPISKYRKHEFLHNLANYRGRNL